MDQDKHLASSLGVVEAPGHFSTTDQSLKALAAHDTLSPNFVFPAEFLNGRVDEVDDVLVADIEP